MTWRLATFCVGIVWAALLIARSATAVPADFISVTQTQVRHEVLAPHIDRWTYYLHNQRITDAVIGYSVMRCWKVPGGGALGSGVLECFASYSLRQGKLVAQGLIKRRSYYTLAVTGGVGIYSLARGQLLARTIAEHPHEERLTFSVELG